MKSLIKKASSIIKKGVTIIGDGMEPYDVGKYNFENPIFCAEIKAEKRAEICSGCRYFKEEPIEYLVIDGEKIYFRIEDKNIPLLSHKSCGKCGCVLPYKTRQSIKECKRWQKQK